MPHGAGALAVITPYLSVLSVCGIGLQFWDEEHSFVSPEALNAL